MTACGVSRTRRPCRASSGAPAARDRAATCCDTAGLVISPGGPYLSMEGALGAIRYAREDDVPLLGTCAGFQHMDS